MTTFDISNTESKISPLFARRPASGQGRYPKKDFSPDCV